MTEAIIKAEDLVTGFGSHIVHDHISFEIHRGSICSIIGGSGSGKTTLLNALLGLLTPFSGKISFFGQDLYSLDNLERSSLLRRSSVLFQECALFSGLTVIENIAFPLIEFAEITKNQANFLAAISLEQVGLETDVGNLMPSELSGGMKKRAALARALILRPEMLFLDEPTSGLDPIAARRFDALIHEIHREMGMTIFMISHDVISIENLSSQVIVLKEGKILADSNYQDLLSNESDWIREYLRSGHATQ